MPRKRKKYRTKGTGSSLRWGLWLAILAVAYIGLLHSKITAMRFVRVSGASQGDQSMIEASLSKYAGVAAMDVNPYVVENDVEFQSDVNRADFSRNVFGRGYLALTCKIPIAKIVGANYAIDKNGTPFSIPLGQTSVLPSIRLSMAALKPHIGLLEPYDLAFMASSETELEKMWPKNEGILTLRDDGTLYLDRGASGLVNFGEANNFQEKFAKLQQILAQTPNPLTNPVILNLVSPSHPAIEPFQRLKGNK